MKTINVLALLKFHTCFNGVHYEAGLLGRSDEILLPGNKAAVVLCVAFEERHGVAGILHSKIVEYSSKEIPSSWLNMFY